MQRKNVLHYWKTIGGLMNFFLGTFYLENYVFFVLTFNCCKKDCISRIYKVFEIHDAITNYLFHLRPFL